MTRRLGKYEVGPEVGRGGMAVVYRGVDATLGRTVAIKLLHPHLAHEHESRQRFHREARAVAQLRHPNIIEIFAYSGLDSDETYIVTEFVDGPDLKRFLAEQPVQIPLIAAMIALELADALAHAHGQGIVHRDIKPENILIQSGGVLKLTDFGIAHLIDDQMTVTGAILGSPAYMSPEHVEGVATDARADVFSLGTLLYRVATGELPFQADSPHALLRQVLDCDVPDPTQHNPLIDSELRGIIGRAMKRDPADRYASVDRMANALRRYLEREGIDDPAGALRHYLSAPADYEPLLARKLIDLWTGRARQAAARGRLARALDYYNRVLVLDEDSEEIIQEVRRLSTRRRTQTFLLRLLGVAAVVALGVTLFWTLPDLWPGDPGAGPSPPVRSTTLDAVAAVPPTTPAVDASPADGEARPVVVRLPQRRRRAALGLEAVSPRRARLGLETRLTKIESPVRLTRPGPRDKPDRRRKPRPDPKNRKVPVVISAFPPAVQINVDGVHRGVGKTSTLQLAAGRHTVSLRHPACTVCAETKESFSLDPKSPPTKPLRFHIRYKPARLRIKSALPGRVSVNRRPIGRTGRPVLVPMGQHRQRDVTVTVSVEGKPPWQKRVRLSAGQELNLTPTF